LEVELSLHVLRIYVVGVHTEGVLQLQRDEAEGPEDEHLHKGESGCPPCLVDPLGNHKGHQNPVQHQKGVAHLSIREGKGNIRNFHRIVKCHHPIRDLLECPGQDWRRYVEYPCRDVLDDVLLNPLKNEFHFCFRLLSDSEALRVHTTYVDERVPEGVNGFDMLTLTIAVLDLGEGDSVQHAEKAYKLTLKIMDDFTRGLRVFAESDHGTAPVEPFRSHPVGRGATIPKTVVCLRCAEDDKKTDEEAEAAPCSVVIHDAPVTYDAGFDIPPAMQRCK